MQQGKFNHLSGSELNELIATSREFGDLVFLEALEKEMNRRTAIKQFNTESKYGNKKTFVDNITFHSAKEAHRYCELKLLLKAGEIKELKLQPKFVLQPEFSDDVGILYRSIVYFADFMYYETKNPDKMIVEDVKGFVNEVYALKKKLFLYKYKHFVFKEL